MTRYELLSAQIGGGNSSVNLMVNEYVGSWTIYDFERRNLIKMPTIRMKMTMPRIFLDTFGFEVYYSYARKCAAILGEQSRQYRRSSN